MKKNAQIHLLIETDVLEMLKRQSKEENISVSELCRQKLSQCSRLAKIEIMLEGINKKLDKNGK